MSFDGRLRENMWLLLPISEDINEDAFGSEPPQKAKNRFKIWLNSISFDSAQVTAFDCGGSRQLGLGPALAQTHRADGRSERQKQLIWSVGRNMASG
jgi:hypothetical protein